MTLYFVLRGALPNVFVDALLVIGMAAVAIAVGSVLWGIGVYLIHSATAHGAHRQEGNPADRLQPRTSHLTAVASRPSMEDVFLYDYERTGSHKR